MSELLGARGAGWTFAAVLASAVLGSGTVPAEEPRVIGEMRLSLLGVSASVEPAAPVVPKNVASGVRVVVRAGGAELSAEDVARFLGGGFQVRAELSGPGLGAAVTLPTPNMPVSDPLLLPLPGLPMGGDYRLTGTRIVVNGQAVLDVSPDVVTVRVIDQVLVTSVQTRPLTLDEIRQRGVLLDSDDYLGYEFTVVLRVETEPVTIRFPAVFDRRGVPVPQPLLPPPPLPRLGIATRPPALQPILLSSRPPDGDGDPPPGGAGGGPPATPGGVTIPALLVIPGDVGYLKQFFSAQLFVANGAPTGSGLVLRDVRGTIHLPAGADGVPGSDDDPLTLPELETGPQDETQPVLGLGPDGEPGTPDDPDRFDPGEQGMADFTVRGELEGFHRIGFDVDAVLDGLPTGPVDLTGKARGGVLVRNPYFDMTFAIPSVVRADEEFDLYVTVTNVGQGTGQQLRVALDELGLSGVELLSDHELEIASLVPGNSATLQYRLRSLRTGEVTAAYLRFDTQGGSAPTGHLRFTVGVDERGVALSPDTLVLPSAVDLLPVDVVRAALRVLGQAWSLSGAPTLPPGVEPIDGALVKQKALALAEAGLRKRLGQPALEALRDLVFDLHGGDTRDDGFDQLLRETQAGRSLDDALGSELEAALGGFGVAAYERDLAEVQASGRDFVSFSVGGLSAGNAELTLTDPQGRVTRGGGASQVPGAALLRLGTQPWSPILGVVVGPLQSRYTLEVLGTGSDSGTLSVTVPRGDGTFAHASVSDLVTGPGSRSRLVLDLGAPDTLVLSTDHDGDGVFEDVDNLGTLTLQGQGPRLVAASVIGPETLAGAAPFGYMTALLFDRTVDAESASDPSRYEVPNNEVEFAKRFLSGRIVLALLDQPEGPYVPTTVRASGIQDGRGHAGSTDTVDLVSLLADAGAVVTGRVLQADGTPVGGTLVTYTSWYCIPSWPQGRFPVSVAAVRTTASGFYQFRYVRQDACAYPFTMIARDPQTQAVRSAMDWVRAPGENINLDLVFLGVGNVAGTVRQLSGAAAPGATVRVVSVTDPQVGALTSADAQGRYAVSGITVGQVVVDASFGTLLGHASGYVAQAGATATVDVNLDGVSNVAGTVFRAEGQDTLPAVGALVVYYAEGTVTGFTQTDVQGRYSFEGMPAGAFRVDAALDTAHHGFVEGSVLPNQTLGGQNIVIVFGAPTAATGTVRGRLLNADGTPASGGWVHAATAGALADSSGSYEMAGVPVLPYQFQTAYGRSLDGLRHGTARFQVNEPDQVVTGVDITLSGLGSVEFTVKDASGAPLPGQQVRLLGGCLDPCGCQPKVTGPDGKVRWDGRPIGTATAQAVRPAAAGYVDVAKASASVTFDGQVAQAVLQFKGAGTVRGLVKNPDGTAAFGADVLLRALKYVNDGVSTCGLVSTLAGTARTDMQGAFAFPNVNVGLTQLTASSVVFPTPVGAQAYLTANGGEVYKVLTLSNTLAGTLSGTVFLPDGVTPAGAGAEVTVKGPLPDVTVLTDSAGQYHFAPILPRGSYTATVRHPATGGLAQERLYLQAGLDATHDFRLLDRGLVRVRVVDATGAPVAAATVTLSEADYPRRRLVAVADASNGGVASFPGIYEGPIVAEARDVYGRGGRASATRPGGTEPIDVTVSLNATGTVAGHFRMPDGVTPIPYGLIRLLSVPANQVLGQATAAGDGDVGAFSFDYVPAGQVRVEAQDPLTARTGFATGSVELDQVLDLEVLAQGLGSVSGQVTHNAAAAPGAAVDLKSGSFKASTSSDGNGAYGIDGVPVGEVLATASYGGGLLKGIAVGVVAQDGQALDLDIGLISSGEVRGVVKKPDGSVAPLSVVKIQSGTYVRSVVTEADGSFRFTPVPSGLSTLTAELIGSIDRGTTVVDLPPGENVDTAVTLNGVGGLSGLTRNVSGPVSGKLTITGTGAFPYTKVIYTPADGRFVLPELLAGPVSAQLHVQSGGVHLYGTTTATITPGQTTDIVVQLQANGSVVGRVLRADSVTPAYGAQVTVRMTANGATLTVTTHTDGTFAAEGLPVGALTVKVTDPATGGVAQMAGLIAADGAVVDVGDVILDDSPLTVLSVDPPDGTTNVGQTHPVTLTFSDPLASTANLSVRRPADAPNVSAAWSLSSDGRVVTGTPGVGLGGKWPSQAALIVVVPTNVTDIYGRHPVASFQSGFTVEDRTPPSVSSVEPANTAFNVTPDAHVTLTFSETLSDQTPFDTLVTLNRLGTAVPGTTVHTAPATVVFAPSSPMLVNSTYQVVVNGAKDLLGNTQTSLFQSGFSTTDTIAPALSIYSPAPSGSWVHDPRVHPNVYASDGGSGLDAATATMQVDGVPVPATYYLGHIAYTPPADLAEGLHPLAASIADRAGNLGSFAGSFGVDTIPPLAAQLLSPTSGQVLSGTVTLAGTAEDPGASTGTGSGVWIVKGYLDGGPWQTIYAPFSMSYNSNLLADGAHTLSAVAIDKANNVGPMGPPVYVVVDNHPITFTFTQPAAGAPFRDSVTVAVSVSQVVDRVEFSINGGVPVVDTTSPYQATLPLASVPEGPATITVTGFAGVNNETGSSTRTIVVDRTAPLAPDASLIRAEDRGDNTALAVGQPGSVEGSARVDITNPSRGVTVSVTATGDGGFTAVVAGATGETLSIKAVDAVNNVGPATTVPIVDPDSGTIPTAGLRMWLKAEVGVVRDGSNKVSQWQDQSPNGTNNHMVMSVAANQPLYVESAYGTRPTVRFDSNDYMNFTQRITNTRTVFWVIKSDPAGSGPYRFLLGDSGHPFISGADSLWHVSQSSPLVRDGLTTINGVAVDGLTTPRPTSLSVVSLATNGDVASFNFSRDGNYNSGYWWGDLSELLIYDRLLSGPERKRVEDYLALKHEIYVPQVAKPTVTPGGGTFTNSVQASISCTTAGAEMRYTVDGSEPTATSTLYEGPLVLTETTTLKAKAFKATFPDSETTVVSFMRAGDLSPASVPGLRLWVRADAGTVIDQVGRVAQWYDQSGNGNHLSQTSSVLQPVLTRDAAGTPVLRFDGANDLMLFPSMTNIQTVFWVLRSDPAAGTSNRPLLGDTNNFDGGAGTIWGSSTAGAVKTTGQTWLNGVLVDGLTTPRPTDLSVISAVASAPMQANRFSKTTYGGYWWGDLAEMVIYDRALSGSERRAVEDYLTLKYRRDVAAAGTPTITPGGGPFTGSVDVSLSTTTPDAAIYYTTDGSAPTPASELYDGPFTITDTTTVRARAYRDDLDPSSVSVATFDRSDTFTPASVSGLQLWARADSGVGLDGNRVNNWWDQSGHGNHLFLASPAVARPTWVPDAANGLPAVRFDGTDDYLMFTTRLTTVRTVFWVLRSDPDAGATARPLLGDASSAPFSAGTTTLLTTLAPPAVEDAQFWMNGAPVDGLTTPRPTAVSVVSIVTTGNISVDRFSKGNATGQLPWWGDLAELAIFDRALSGAERHQVEEYLLVKYAQPAARVAMPTVTPNGGRFTFSSEVALATTTPGAQIRYTLDGTQPDEQSTLYSDPFFVDATTTVKAKAFRPGLPPSATAVVTFIRDTDFTPASLTGLLLWTRADSGVETDGDRVTKWKDQSAGANDLYRQFPSIGIPSWTSSAIGSQPAVHLDGVDDYLVSTTRITTVRTVFWVLKADPGSGGTSRPLLGDTATPNSFYGGAPTLWHPTSSSTYVRNGTTRLNGYPVNGATTPRPTTDAIVSLVTTANVAAGTLARYSGTSPFWGDVAELVVYDRPLNTNEVRDVEQYLSQRYDIPVVP